MLLGRAAVLAVLTLVLASLQGAVAFSTSWILGPKIGRKSGGLAQSCAQGFLPSFRLKGLALTMARTSTSYEGVTLDDWFKKEGMTVSSQSLGGSSWAQNYK